MYLESLTITNVTYHDLTIELYDERDRTRADVELSNGKILYRGGWKGGTPDGFGYVFNYYNNRVEIRHILFGRQETAA